MFVFKSRRWRRNEPEVDLLGFKYKKHRDAYDRGEDKLFLRVVCPHGYREYCAEQDDYR